MSINKDSSGEKTKAVIHKTYNLRNRNSFGSTESSDIIDSKQKSTKKRGKSNLEENTNPIDDNMKIIEAFNDKDNCKGLNSSTLLSNSDQISIAVLIMLYTLQGIPMGLSASIPLILKEKGATYSALSLFSLVSLPFSLKLLWAPFVDSYYLKSIGRRKTWLIPVQLITGIVMIVGASYIAIWLGDEIDPNTFAEQTTTQQEPSIGNLSSYFFLLYFLMATQDIAVDGWALTMLSRESVGYSSVCNSIGQILGIFMANQGFIALSDARWCHHYLGTTDGALINLADFMRFWGYIFIITTFLIWVFKKEDNTISKSEHTESLLETCKHVVSIFQLPCIRTLAIVLLTCKIAFAPTDAIFGFKLQEYGMPKSDIATISPILLITNLVLPAIVGNIISSRPLDIIILAIPIKIVASVALWTVLQFTTSIYAAVDSGVVDGPSYYYLVPLIACMLLNEVAGNMIFISMMSFFSKISDPTIGGSYMTLLNTLANLGSKWPNSLSLYILPTMTYNVCESYRSGQQEIFQVSCAGSDHICKNAGGTCNIQLDGYTIQVILGVIIGFLWLLFFANKLKSLQALPHIDWMISKPTSFSLTSVVTSENTIQNTPQKNL